MAKQTNAPENWYQQEFGAILRCVMKDYRAILLVAAALAFLGLVAGQRTRGTESTAQLVLMTPLPLQVAVPSEGIAEMMAGTMDVTTASLLCESDEAMEMVRTRLNESGKLRASIDNLWKLKSMLTLKITVSLETPYATEYSPIIELTAKGATPAEAKLVADTWAEVSVELAETYRVTRQGHPVTAYALETDDLRENLDEAELEVEAFWSKNAVELFKQRADFLIGGINEIKDTIVRINHEITRERARLEILAEALAIEEPVRQLKWIPSGRLAALVTDAVAPNARSDAGGEASGEANMLVREEVNPVYLGLRQEQVVGEANLRGQEVELLKLEETLAEYEQELEGLQALTAQLLRVEKRMTRDVNIFEAAYTTAAGQLQYAQIAERFQQPPLQILSRGAEWNVPRFRRGASFGLTGAMVGAIFGVAASIVLRRVVEPAMAATS